MLKIKNSLIPFQLYEKKKGGASYLRHIDQSEPKMLSVVITSLQHKNE